MPTTEGPEAAGDGPRARPRRPEFFPLEHVTPGGGRRVWQIRVTAQDAQGRPVPIEKAWLRPGARTPPGVVGVITTTSYQVSSEGVCGRNCSGGKPTIVRAGKNIGKANATNPVTQAIREAQSRYNARLKQVQAVPLADAPRSEKPPPMLVKRHRETRGATLTPRDFARGVTVQRKYNGVRAVMFLAAGEPPAVVIYSRTKTDFAGLNRLRREALSLLAGAPPVPEALIVPPPECREPAPGGEELARLRGAYAGDRPHLDGEIYLHGKTLQWISGQARRNDDEDALNFMVFDCFFPAAKAAGHDMVSVRRQEYLTLLFGGPGAPFRQIRRVENFPATDLAGVEMLGRRSAKKASVRSRGKTAPATSSATRNFPQRQRHKI